MTLEKRSSDTMRTGGYSSSTRLRVRAASLFPGAIVLRRFVAQRKIAAGGMGEVWLGEHTQLRLRVALKVLRREAHDVHEVGVRFSREAFLLGQIHSDHVARVYDFSSSGKFGPVLVMEFIEGPPLSLLLRSKRFTVEEAIQLGIDLASALREVHAAGIVHRDVKPANVIVRPHRDGTHRAVFIDLGVSRFVPSSSSDDESLTEITCADRAVGTLEYMAPEQILCSHEAEPAADLYAVGAILHRAVTGENVFRDVHGMTLAKVKLTEDAPPTRTGRTDRVARTFEEFLGRALSRRAENRYELADEMLADLCLLRDRARHVAPASTRLLPVRPQPARPPPPLPPKRSTRWLPRAALLLLIAFGVAVAFASRDTFAHTERAPSTCEEGH